jgi:exopolysaccharide biosynthesis polyprenyl glycosylphosphotransferase
MASKMQNAWTWLPIVYGAGVGRAPIPGPGPLAGEPLDRLLHTTARFKPQQRPNGSRQIHGGRWVQWIYAIIDICFIVANSIIAFQIRFSAGGLPSGLQEHLSGALNLPFAPYGGFLLLYVALVLLFCDWQDLYRTPRLRSAQQESIAIIKAVTFATLLLSAFVYLSGVRVLPRVVVASSLILNVATLVAWRYAKRKIVIRRAMQGTGLRNVAIIGAGAVGQELAHEFMENKLLGYDFKGFLDRKDSGDPRLIGKIEDLAKVARSHFLDEVIITIPSERELIKRIAVVAQKQKLDVKVVPELYDGLGWDAPIQQIGNFPVMQLLWQPIPTLGLLFKRVFDVLLSTIALVASAPIVAALAIWIKLDSPGPVFYRSRRVGKKGRVFTCYKLRTMLANSEEMKDSLRHRNERKGPCFKINDDPRITRLGKFLRKYSLDELPQFWNVLKGDMSLVGPRPHPLDDFKRYSLEHLCRLHVKPGITGLWQVEARRDPSFETNMALDLQYIDNWNLWLDLKILGKTLPVILQGAGQ